MVQRRPLPLKTTTPIPIATTGIRKVSLTEAASPAAIPAMISGPLSSSGASRSGASCTAPAGGRSSLVAVDQEGGEGEQEGEAHDVVAPLAGLGLDHHPGVEDDRRRDQRRRADLVGAADAPGGEQRDREPDEVDQRREPVALEEDDRRRRGPARSWRVEPGGEPQRVGEVQVDVECSWAIRRREGHVVPGRVAAEHAVVEARAGRGRSTRRR